MITISLGSADAGPRFKHNFRLELPADGRRTVARTLRVDETHANPYRVWELLGRERNPPLSQIALLRESAAPACRYLAPTTGEGPANLDLTLGKNACLLVDLIPVEDHTAEYYGLDRDFYDRLSIPSGEG